MAEEANLDLIEISPNAVPPVAKISDYGKYKYEAQKKAHEARRHQKVIEVKEIKMRPNIDDHDYEVKMKAMKRFIEEGDKVKVTLRFRGREMVHADLGMQVLNRVRGEMDPVTKIESMPRMEGRQMVWVVDVSTPTRPFGVANCSVDHQIDAAAEEADEHHQHPFAAAHAADAEGAVDGVVAELLAGLRQPPRLGLFAGWDG